MPEEPTSRKAVIDTAILVVTVAGLAAAGTWALFSWRSQSELNYYKSVKEGYEQAKNWELPETLKALNEASIKLRVNQDEREMLVKLKHDLEEIALKNAEKDKEISTLQQKHLNLEQKHKEEIALKNAEKDKEISTLQQKHLDLEQKNKVLERDLRQTAISVESIELGRGDAHRLIPNYATLGVKYIHTDSVSINLLEKDHSLSIGNSISFNFADQTCRVVLIKVAESEKKAHFAFGCREG